ncbi:MAG: xylulokinase [Gaiellales bacterium]|nr:xylulokinase [Gaiellales bacterium]
MSAALGIDVGMSGVRAAVVDEHGAVLGAGRAAAGARLTADRAEADPRDWLSGALEAGAAAVAEADVAVDAVAVSALGPAPVLVTRQGEAVSPALLFGLDRRAEEQRARLGVTHDHALPKLLWWAEHEPERLARAATAVDAAGFVVAGLCGEIAMDSITAEAYAVEGVDPPLPLPRPCDPLARVGGILPAAAGTLGVTPGTPVIAGTLDSYADVAGTGAAPGTGCLLLGSTLIAYAVWHEPVSVPGLEVQHLPAPGVLVGGSSVSGGATIDWLGGLLGEAPGDLHALEPGAGGLLVLPYLAGERTPVNDPHASGAVLGLTYATTRDELSRAFVDAVALSALDHADRLRACGIDPARWRVAGGGTQNGALVHACSDALGRPLDVMPHAGAAIGPAALALRAAGARWRPSPERTIDPDAARTARFAVLLEAYRGAYEGLAPTMRRLADLR